MGVSLIPVAGVVEGVAKTVGSLATLVGGKPSSGSIAQGVDSAVVQSAVAGNMAAAYVLDFRRFRGVASEKAAWAKAYSAFAAQAPAVEAQYRALLAQYPQGLPNGPYIIFLSPQSGGYAPGANGYSPDTTQVASQALAVPWFSPKVQSVSPNQAGVQTNSGAAPPIGTPPGATSFLATVPTWVWIVLALAALLLFFRGRGGGL